MATITVPSTMPIRRIQWSLTQPTQLNRSGWTGARQVVGLAGGNMWRASAEFAPIVGEASVRPWRSFFAKLLGNLNVFQLPASEGQQHSGSEPTISSGSSGATSVVCSASQSLVKAGMFATIKLADGSYQLVQVTSDFTTTTLNFLPSLRQAPATGAGSLETKNPYCVVCLSSDTTGWAVDPGQVYTIAFDAEESY